MEFNEKLQHLRKQRGLTQEELAEFLFVSRTAISKWESGRGYPSIESIKLIAKFYSISIDELLSNDELLVIAEEDNKKKEKYYNNLVFGILDICVMLFFFLPLFANRTEGKIEEVSLIFLTEVSYYLRVGYFLVVIISIILGILTLSLQNCYINFWNKNKNKLSIIISIIGIVLFILSLQPYPSLFLLMFLVIKIFLLLKW